MSLEAALRTTWGVVELYIKAIQTHFLTWSAAFEAVRCLRSTTPSYLSKPAALELSFHPLKKCQSLGLGSVETTFEKNLSRNAITPQPLSPGWFSSVVRDMQCWKEVPRVRQGSAQRTQIWEEFSLICFFGGNSHMSRPVSRINQTDSRLFSKSLLYRNRLHCPHSRFLPLGSPPVAMLYP